MGNIGLKFVFHTQNLAKIAHATLKTSLLPCGARPWRKIADSADSIRGYVAWVVPLWESSALG